MTLCPTSCATPLETHGHRTRPGSPVHRPGDQSLESSYSGHLCISNFAIFIRTDETFHTPLFLSYLTNRSICHTACFVLRCPHHPHLSHHPFDCGTVISPCPTGSLVPNHCSESYQESLASDLGALQKSLRQTATKALYTLSIDVQLTFFQIPKFCSSNPRSPLCFPIELLHDGEIASSSCLCTGCATDLLSATECSCIPTVILGMSFSLYVYADLY